MRWSNSVHFIVIFVRLTPISLVYRDSICIFLRKRLTYGQYWPWFDNPKCMCGIYYRQILHLIVLFQLRYSYVRTDLILCLQSWWQDGFRPHLLDIRRSQGWYRWHHNLWRMVCRNRDDVVWHSRNLSLINWSVTSCSFEDRLVPTSNLSFEDICCWNCAVNSE